ncbi:hypothetical protein AB2J22_21270 [Aeromonas sp. A5]|uniref:hypothetical protein n=1 Tax=unclassified Aeromonas TaxID=257493 RepID=UPI003770473F
MNAILTSICIRSCFFLLFVFPYSKAIGNTFEFISLHNSSTGEVSIMANGGHSYSPRIVGASGVSNSSLAINYYGYAAIACPDASKYNSGPCDISSSTRTWNMYESNPIVPEPYIGLACPLKTTECPSTGYFGLSPNAQLRIDGIYNHGQGSLPNLATNAIKSWPRVSYSYLKAMHDMGVGDSHSTSQTFCAGFKACNENSTDLTLIKKGDIDFDYLNQESTIIIDSNGIADIVPGSKGCELKTISGVNGVACEALRYNTRGDKVKVYNAFTIGLSTVNTNAASMGINNKDVKFSFDGIEWFDGGVISTDRVSGNKMSVSDTMYIFFSPKYLKAIMGTSRKKNNLSSYFAVSFQSIVDNMISYRFWLPTKIGLITRNYNVSILSQDGVEQPYRSGEVGKDILVFPYYLLTSGPGSTTSMAISITQDIGTPYGNNCTFYQNDNQISVPAILNFMGGAYYQKKYKVSCDGSQIDISDILRYRAPTTHPSVWNDKNVNDITNYYKIRLIFDLRDPMLFTTTSGDTWEGEATQTGKITFTATWN